MHKLFLRLMTAIVCFALGIASENGFAQDGSEGSERQASSTPEGFRQLQGRHMTFITDLPIDAAMQQLPAVFDAAMPFWGEYFGVPEATWSRWHVTAYLIGDRNRFKEAGYIPDQLPPFVNGYQLEDQLWCIDQPSDYYRRHLLLHEGTHWFMYRALGSAGPPWYMEGMAEKIATHRWEEGKLSLDVFPDRREGFEYWGRLRLIRELRSQPTRPTLEGILRYGPTAHQQVDAYAWSWAAVWFLKNHPRSAGVMERMRKKRLDDVQEFTPRLLVQLRPHWKELTTSWNAWIEQIDYGADMQRDIPEIDFSKELSGSGPYDVKIAADRGWQDSGIRLRKGDKIRISAKGRFKIGNDPKPWYSEPDGVTIEYFLGQPLGRLLALVAAPDASGGSRVGSTSLKAVGSQTEWTSEQDGVLLLKINEPSLRLSDNEGMIDAKIEVDRKSPNAQENSGSEDSKPEDTEQQDSDREK